MIRFLFFHRWGRSFTKSFAMESCSPLKKRQKTKSDDMKKFDAVFAQIVKDLTENSSAELKDAAKWFEKALKYNVPHGKRNRGMAVLQSYRYLVPEETANLNETNAIILGWCVELLQADFLIADDIMDESLTRRGRPCWYKQEDVGMMAINDSLYVESCIYFLLQKYFRKKACYLHIVELFHEINMKTIHGQCLDMLTEKQDVTQFTVERYSAIVKYKTAHYSFRLPVALALYLADINDESSHAIAEKILLKMGHFFQVQDDFLDCFGDSVVTGKIGTDIEDNKCSWMIVKALELCSAEQLQIIKNNYGKHDATCAATIKTVYDNLGLQQIYKQYENSSYRELCHIIDTECNKLPKDVFYDFANKIYKRVK